VEGISTGLMGDTIPEFVIRQGVPEDLGHRCGIFRRNQPTVFSVADDIGNSPDAASGGRDPSLHGFQDRVREPFAA